MILVGAVITTDSLFDKYAFYVSRTQTTTDGDHSFDGDVAQEREAS